MCIRDSLHAWIEETEVRQLLQRMPSDLGVDAVAKLNVLAQLDRVRTFPCVAEGLASGKLSLSGWFFEVATGEVEWWSDDEHRFVPIGEGRGALGRPSTVPTVHA